MKKKKRTKKRARNVSNPNRSVNRSYASRARFFPSDDDDDDDLHFDTISRRWVVGTVYLYFYLKYNSQ